MSAIVTPDQLVAALSPAITAGMVRYHARNRHRNGLAESGAIFWGGRGFLFDIEKYIHWLRSRPAERPSAVITPKSQSPGKAATRRRAVPRKNAADLRG